MFPGSGITVFSVWDTPFEWWRVYVREVDAWHKAQMKSEEAPRGR